MRYRYRCSRIKVPQSIYKFTKRCALSAMMSALVTIIHIKIVVFDDAKWISSKYYESNKSSWLYETSRNILCNSQLFNSFAVHMYHHKSYTIYLTRKSDKNHNDKEAQNMYLINEG